MNNFEEETKEPTKPNQQQAEAIEENDFKINYKKTTNVQKLKSASLLIIPLSVYQIFFGMINSNYYPHWFISTYIVSGILMIISALFVNNWTRKIIQGNEQMLDPYRPLRENKPISRLIFVSSLLQMVLCKFILVNLFFYKGYSHDYLTSQASNPEVWESLYNGSSAQQIEETVSTMRMTGFIVQALLLIYHFSVAEVAWKSMDGDDIMMSQLISVSNTFMVFAGLGLCWSLTHVFPYSNEESIDQVIPDSVLKLMLTNAIMIVIFGFVAWVVNHRKWRVGFSILALFFTLSICMSVAFTGSLFKHTRELYEEYSDVALGDKWSKFMGSIAESELIKGGCPNKYTPNDSECPKVFKSFVWENDLTLGNQEMQCLNTECAGTLGQVYSEEYLKVVNFGILMTVFATLNLVGMFHFLTNSTSLAERKSRTHYIFLGLMFVSVASYAYNKVNNNPGIMEHYPGNSKALELGNFYGTHPALESFSFASGFDLDGDDFQDEQLMSDLFGFLIFHSNKYLILQPPPSDNEDPILYTKGDPNANFEDFAFDLHKAQHGLGFYWVQVEHIYRLFMVIYVDESTPDSIKQQYDISDGEIEDDVPVILLNKEEELKSLKINELMIEYSEYFRLQEYEIDDDADYGFYDDDFIMNTQAFKLMQTAEFAEDSLVTAIDDFFDHHNYKYISSRISGSQFKLSETGDIYENYIDYVKSLPSDQFRFTVYRFAYEQVEAAVLILWGLEFYPTSEKEAFRELISGPETIPFAIMIANDYEELDMNYLVQVGALTDEEAIKENVQEVKNAVGLD